MKSKCFKFTTSLMMFVLCFVVLLSGCNEQSKPQVTVPTVKPTQVLSAPTATQGVSTESSAQESSTPIATLETLSTPKPTQGNTTPDKDNKGEHYAENMSLFGDLINNVYAYECVYQFYKNADKESAFSNVVDLKEMVMAAIEKDVFLNDSEKSTAEKEAEKHLNTRYNELSLNCKKTPDAIAKEIYGITFEQYKKLKLCETLANKYHKQLVEELSQKSINESDLKKFYNSDKNTYDFAVLRYISYKLDAGGSSSGNQSKTREAEKLCSKLQTVKDMLNIINGASGKQSEGNANGKITVHMNETDSLYYEFLEEGGTKVNSKTVVHNKNNAYVVMCEAFYTWENSEDIKKAVKQAYIADLAEKEMISSVNLKYTEPEDWYKMSGLGEINAAKNIDDYSSVMSKLEIASKADTIFLTVQEPGSKTDCRFYAYEKKNGEWEQVFKTPGYVGRSGIEDPTNRVEGNGTTPSGVYSFGMLFGINDNPGSLQKPYKKVDNDDYWDGDRYSDTYNQYVKGSEMPSSWNSGASEHLIDYKYSYNYAVMVNYNVNPTIKGKGSAIFLHCTRPGALSSAGCISIPEDKMIKSLRMIDDNAYIVIVEEIEDILKFYK